MSAPAILLDRARASRLRDVDLAFFREGGVSPFALLGYGAALMATQAVETVLDLGFVVTRERVRFLRTRRFVRERECRGEPDDALPAYLLPAIEGGFVVDTVAWHPRSGRMATENGRAGLLGADALALASRTAPLLVAPDPRAWLAGWREGVCVVDERLAGPALREAGVPLQAADISHSEALDAMLRKVSVPTIYVPASSVESVAA